MYSVPVFLLAGISGVVCEVEEVAGSGTSGSLNELETGLWPFSFVVSSEIST